LGGDAGLRRCGRDVGIFVWREPECRKTPCCNSPMWSVLLAIQRRMRRLQPHLREVYRFSDAVEKARAEAEVRDGTIIARAAESS